MHTQSTAALKEDLLKLPAFFTRQFPKQFLYAPYSRKLFRQVYCYTHLRYDLWALVESDLSVKNYNELPCKFPLACNGKVRHIRAAFVVEKRSGAFEVHFIDRNEEDDTDNLDVATVPGLQQAIQDWGDEHGFSIVTWTAESLRTNAVRLANLKELLRYVCIPGRLVDISLIEQIDLVLRQTRVSTVDHVVRTLAAQEEAWVNSAIAKMILDQQCYSDIDKHPFHYATELSVHHAFV